MLKGKKIIATVTNPLFHDKRMIRICSTLAKQGADVTLLGVKRPGVPGLEKQIFKQKLLVVPFQKGFLFYASYNIILFFRLLFKSFDLAIAVDLDTLTAVSIACRLRGKPWIFDSHEYFTEVPELEGKPFVKKFWSLIARLAGEYNMTVSESLAKELGEKYHRTFQVVRNLPEKTIQDQVKQSDITEEKTVNLIYYGYLNQGRGLEYAIRALLYLPERFRLILAGGGDLTDDLKALCKSLGLDQRVDFTGWISVNDSEMVLKKGHIGLNLLDGQSRSYYYSLANKTFDYLRIGIPAIHMDFPEYSALKDKFDCIDLIDELDPLLLSQKIRGIVENQPLYLQMSQNALKAAEELCWEKEQEKLLNFVSSVFEQA